MPIEIKELHIKAVVQEEAATQSNNQSASAPAKQFDALVAECVEQVLQILKEKEER
jgi:Family of unknown function (DUF5908)